MSAPWIFRFYGEADFEATIKAERFLEAAGFSVGPSQRGSPRGVLFGDYGIQKWRNLRPADRAELHGELNGDGRHGPITVSIRHTAPPEAHAALHSTPASA